jgi:intracellular multiplication protein IcmD
MEGVKMKFLSVDANKLAKVAGSILVVAMTFFVVDAFAQAAGGTGGTTIGTIATNITGSFTALGKLILAIAFVGGLGFVMAAIFKFKQHKDNPTQIPLGTPIAMLAIGIVLMFLPGIIAPAGATLFGADAGKAAGGFTGDTGVANLPGSGSGTSNP